MEQTKFEKLIIKRAEERVDLKLRTFKDEITKACAKLTGKSSQQNTWMLTLTAKAVLNCMMSDDHKKGWPQYLWTEEQDKVRNELYQIMDEMQKAFIAAGKMAESEFTPAEEDTNG